MFKVNNQNTRTTSLTSIWCFYCSFWTHFTPFSSIFIVKFEQVNVTWVLAQSQRWRRSGIFIFNFEHISHLFSSVSIVAFEQVNVSWAVSFISSVHSSNLQYLLYTKEYQKILLNVFLRKVKCATSSPAHLLAIRGRRKNCSGDEVIKCVISLNFG